MNSIRSGISSRVLVAAAALISSAMCWAAGAHEEPQDTNAALFQPDQYAWRLFVALNWPANVAQRAADPARKFGENDITVWESWKLSSGPNDEVFLAQGKDPGQWLDGAKRPSIRSLDSLEFLPKQQEIRALQRGTRRGFRPFFDPLTSAKNRNENHLNKAAFEFIRANELFHIGGQEALLQKAFDLRKAAVDKLNNGGIPAPFEYRKKLIDFPAAAKEVKAQWRPITEQEKQRYRWQEFVDSDGKKVLYGLTALHITTKDLPNWLWATFEHVDNPSRKDSEGWIIPSNDSSASPQGYPQGLGIEGTRWENYRLRGTQTEFTTGTGMPTVLANSQIEEGFQTSSSCITCHAMASVGRRKGSAVPANRLSIFSTTYPSATGGVVIGPIGIPQAGLFESTSIDNDVVGELNYLQLDFVWSLMRAKRQPAP